MEEKSTGPEVGTGPGVGPGSDVDTWPDVSTGPGMGTGPDLVVAGNSCCSKTKKSKKDTVGNQNFLKKKRKCSLCN